MCKHIHAYAGFIGDFILHHLCKRSTFLLRISSWRNHVSPLFTNEKKRKEKQTNNNKKQEERTLLMTSLVQAVGRKTKTNKKSTHTKTPQRTKTTQSQKLHVLGRKWYYIWPIAAMTTIKTTPPRGSANCLLQSRPVTLTVCSTSFCIATIGTEKEKKETKNQSVTSL